MTIVELFDEKPINNIVGILAFNPDKVIYVGGYTRKHFESKKLPILKKYLDRKGYSALDIEYVQVRRDSFKDIMEKFENIYSSDSGCVFHVEVTGGEDLILIGLGALSQRRPDIELYQISSKLRTIRSFSLSADDGRKLDIECRNTVEENLLLHGASIISANGDETFPGGYRFDADFVHDINIMWDICCRGSKNMVSPSAPNSWNKVTIMLASLNAEDPDRENQNLLCIDAQRFKEEYMTSINGTLFYDYICYFIRCDLLDCRIESEHVYINFKNDQVRMCLTKAGLILELKTYLICKKLMDSRDGDCLTSVTIDWDGDENLASTIKYLYNLDDPDSTIDTTNEIDILATCGLIPYFISCKNGKFTSEELYKLYLVGEQFGKGYCQKIIVTTDLNHALGDAKNVILQRAVDIGIQIIEDVHKKTDDEIADELKKVMELPKIKTCV